MAQFLEDELQAIRAKGQYRVLGASSAQTARTITLAGQELVNFSSNDYLGLAHHPKVKQSAAEAAMRDGAGSGASRLITGNLDLHEQLEHEIAAWKGTEAALLFNSGYHANISAIPALVDERDVILSDAANHASLIDGCKLSKAERSIFPHNDMAALEDLLKKMKRFRHRLIVTESVFSMDGDRAALLDLQSLAERYDAWIYLDEAHATGVLGKTGAGLVEELEIAPERRERLIQMGTLGKALGSFGAYVAGSRALKEFLVNRARAFIFTTALPPAVVAASRAAVAVVRSNRDLQDKLWANIRYFHKLLEGTSCHREASETSRGDPVLAYNDSGLLRYALQGFARNDKAESSAIVPIILGDEKQVLNASAALRDRGLFVQAIRPPTVPAGTSRLRLTFSAAHRQGDIEQLLHSIEFLSK